MIIEDFGNLFSWELGYVLLRYRKKRHSFIDTPPEKCCYNHMYALITSYIHANHMLLVDP